MSSPDVPEHSSKREVMQILSSINSQAFQSWRRERVRARNIKQGNPHRNEPPRTLPPEQHNPSRLLQCHRKTYYQYHNAPAETRQPVGVFWFGSQFETELFRPFLQSLTAPNLYVQNSAWIDFTVSAPEGELQFRGRTDPVIVEADGTPQLLTEIKTTSSFARLDAPKPHHRAQMHAYLEGLSRKHDLEIREAVIVYVKRDDLTLKVFLSTFDAKFWKSQVLTWAAKNTGYRLTDELPPADPEHGWECRFCAFRQRCGKTDAPFSDAGPQGLLPLTDAYPRERLKKYLSAYPEAQLTPTLANRYPALVDEYGVYDWECQVCKKKYTPDAVDWNGDTAEPPLCSSCGNEGVFATLAGPSPDAQIVSTREE